MIRHSIFLLVFFCPFYCYAQSATDEAFEKACDCFNSVNFNSLTLVGVSASADSCIQEAFYTNLTAVLKENNASIEDAHAMHKLALSMQTHLSENCKGFFHFSVRMAEKEVMEVKETYPSERGLLYDFNKDNQFPVFTVITEDHQARKFIWFREFDGSTRFMNGIKSYKNTVVDIYWKEIELYDAATQKYPYQKEILLIEEIRVLGKEEQKAWVGTYNLKINK